MLINKRLSNKGPFIKKRNLTTSVVIVTHNRKARLKKCIESIMLNHTSPKEIIVIDDSDEGKDFRELINGFRKSFSGNNFIYRRVFPKRGVSFSRNLGIRVSSGDVIAFIDDDCDANPDWIEKMIASHITHPNAASITGYVSPKYPKNYWNRVLFKFHDIYDEERKSKAKKTDFLFGANYSFKREVFSKYKIYFNDRMIHCSEDRYISFKLLKNNFLLLYDPSIRVYHDFRIDVLGVFNQWFRYGLSDYFFWKLTPDFHDPDSDYFRTGSSLRKVLKAPYRVPKRIFTFIEHLKVKETERGLIPGLIFIFLFYYLGVYFGLMKDQVLSSG